ncbi:MAG TPA: hypothetical protein PLN23_08570 [Fervidobacterium sp.]|nr:hypothetical protein [Fervidobacterium sp.]
MIKNIILEGIVSYDVEYDLWCVDEDFIENIISDFEGKKVVVTITVI